MPVRKALLSIGRAMRSAFAIRQAVNRTVRPCLMESLERRQLLTAVFSPVFGTETLLQDGGKRLASPQVVLIFWGSYWGSGTSTAAVGVWNQANALLTGTNYLSGTKEYGTSGAATLSEAVGYIATNPVSGHFAYSDIEIVANAAISSGQVDSSATDIYEVITAPGITSTIAGYNGINQEFNGLEYAWISTGNTSTLSYDWMTTVMGQQAASVMTDPGGTGIEFTSGTTWTGASVNYADVGDYEANAYRFREPNGVLVAPLWSKANSDFEVADGNKQKFNLTPVWNGSTFSGTYNLTINGDQLGANYNDNFSLLTANSNTAVTAFLNGESENFDPNTIAKIVLNTGGGTDTVDIYDVPATCTVAVNCPGPDTVNIGLGNTQSIAGNVTISNESEYFTTINVDDSADTAARTGFVNSGSIGGIMPGIIFYTGSETLAVNVTTGTAADENNVYSTSVTTNLNSAGGKDTVFVGDGGDLSGIAGTLNISNTPSASTIYIEGGDATAAQTVGITGTSVTGLTPAAINFTANEVAGLNIYAGNTSSTGDIINISGTPGGPANRVTFLDADVEGKNQSFVYVTGTTGQLHIDGGASTANIYVGQGSLANIHGAINVTDVSGAVFLGFIDLSDTTARTVTLNSNSLVWKNYAATVTWVPTATTKGGVTQMALDGGSGENSITITDTANLMGGTYIQGNNQTINVQQTHGLLTLNGTKGVTKINVGSVSGTLAGILAEIYTYDGGGTDNLYINDNGDSTGRSVVITNSTITGLSPGEIMYNSVDTLVNLKLGTGNDKVTASGVVSSTNYTIDGGAGNNTLVGGANQAHSWDITGSNSGMLDGNLTFSKFQNLTGANDQDDFVFKTAGSVAGDVVGGGGFDALDYSSRSVGVTVNLATGTATSTGGVSGISDVVGTTGNDTITAAPGGGSISGDGGKDTLIGGAGNDEFAIAATQLAGTTISGGGGANTLVAFNESNTWDITGTNSGTINTFAFTNIQNLIGGPKPDTFVFGAAGSITGKITSNGGVDTLDESAKTTAVTVNLSLDSATNTGGFVPGITSFIGGSGNNTLIGSALPNSFTITGANSGTCDAGTFKNFANLTGTAAYPSIFKFTTGGSVSGIINGVNAGSVISYSGAAKAVTVNLATKTATSTGGFLNINSIVGGTMTNTLIGANLTNTWNITGANAGNINGTFTFTGFSTLTGGTGMDNFIFAAAGSVTGKVNGGTGTNTLNFAAKSTAVSVDLQTSAATSTGGFTGITSFIGGTGTNTLIGANTTNAWTITSSNVGKINGTISYSHFGNLTGGTGLDTFKFSAAAAVTGKISSGGGTSDWLDYSSYTTAVSVNLTTNTATGTAGIVGIENVKGGNGVDTLTGNTFGNILIGGNAADTITAGTGRSILIGRGGADHVIGKTADDVVIGGSTTFDANFAALQSILAEWKSANSFAVRVSHIKTGGGLNGTNKLILGSTVIDDSLINTLAGGGGDNWFFKGAHDVITDLHVTDQVN